MNRTWKHSLWREGRRAHRARAAISAVAFCVMPAVAWAQKPARLVEEDGGWLQWVIAAALVVVVCLTAFINPKRSHLT